MVELEVIYICYEQLALKFIISFWFTN